MHNKNRLFDKFNPSSKITINIKGINEYMYSQISTR